MVFEIDDEDIVSSIALSVPLAVIKWVGMFSFSNIISGFSKKHSIFVPRLSVLFDPQIRLWELKSLSNIYGFGSWALMFSRSAVRKLIMLFGKFKLHIVILFGMKHSVAIISKVELILICLQ